MYSSDILFQHYLSIEIRFNDQIESLAEESRKNLQHLADSKILQPLYWISVYSDFSMMLLSSSMPQKKSLEYRLTYLKIQDGNFYIANNDFKNCNDANIIDLTCGWDIERFCEHLGISMFNSPKEIYLKSLIHQFETPNANKEQLENLRFACYTKYSISRDGAPQSYHDLTDTALELFEEVEKQLGKYFQVLIGSSPWRRVLRLISFHELSILRVLEMHERKDKNAHNYLDLVLQNCKKYQGYRDSVLKEVCDNIETSSSVMEFSDELANHEEKFASDGTMFGQYKTELEFTCANHDVPFPTAVNAQKLRYQCMGAMQIILSARRRP